MYRSVFGGRSAPYALPRRRVRNWQCGVNLTVRQYAMVIDSEQRMVSSSAIGSTGGTVARSKPPAPMQSVSRLDPADEMSDDDEYGLEIVRPSRGARAAAALSYLAAMSVVVVAARPARRFPFLHSRIALVLHVARFLLTSGALFVWWQTAREASTPYNFAHFTSDAGLLLLTGIPRTSTLGSDALIWVLTPLLVTWLLSLLGFALSAKGLTLDLRSLTHADWNDLVQRADWDEIRALRERQRARIARQRHVDRLRQTQKAVGVERVRRERSLEAEEQIGRLQAERSHIDQLLALGEISRRRYDSLFGEIDEEIIEQRAAVDEMRQRQTMPTKVPSRIRVGRLDRSPESQVETIAIVAPSGIPLFTYGTFQIDNAIVAGMLSAFDGISEEVFGSRVHKTELAEGQVLHFAHGQYIIVLAIFVEEPSPRQVEQLRSLLQQFEAANVGPLSRGAFDPDFLHEITSPFTFRERI